jgi:predicted cobalt transporter CbtA
VPLVPSLKAALFAGLIAGAATAAFHWVLIEPLIDQAIVFEGHASAAAGPVLREPVVDRPTQRIGLVLGMVLYGVVWGLFFGAAFRMLEPRFPANWSRARRGAVLAPLFGWSVGVFPFLKYPANPPGVGDPETIIYRQLLYFGFIVLAVLGIAMAGALGRSLHQAFRSRQWLGSVAVYVAFAIALYLALPANPDPVPLPVELVSPFRAISLAGLVLFWTLFGAAFGWLARERP